MEHRDTTPEQVVARIRELLAPISSTIIPSVLIEAGDEMGGEFDEGIKFIEHGVRQALRALSKQ